MQSMQSYQRIVLKGVFLHLAVFLCLVGASISHAGIPKIDGEAFFKDLIEDKITSTQAIQTLQKEMRDLGLPDIPTTEIQKLVTNLEDLKNLKDLDPKAAGKIIDGILGDKVDLSQITEIGGMLKELKDGKIDIPLVNGLLEKVGIGEIPPVVGEALSKLEDLKKLADIESLKDLIKNPEILKSLKDLKALGKIPEEIAEALAGITNLVSDIKEFPQKIAEELVKELEKIAPELADFLKEIGGVEALTDLLSSLIGGTPGIPGDGENCGHTCEACKDCAPKINTNHRRIRAHFTSEFEQHRTWFVTNFFLDTIAPAMARMTSQLAATSMQRMHIIGSFFDAEHQLKTQRLFQKLSVDARGDYRVSPALCEIGTNFRSLEPSKQRSKLTHTTLANRMMSRQLLNGDNISSGGSRQDRDSRIDLFIRKFCKKTDHAGALIKLCKDGGDSPNQMNLDIDYTNAIDNKLTLEVDFTDDGDSNLTEDEENIFALSSNLFANEVLPAIADDLLVKGGTPTENVNYLLDLRAIAAKRSVAQNSFAAITALKAESRSHSSPFLKAILQKSGVEPKDIEERLGKNPSLYAQQEILMKDLFRNPEFYANLYDKPANIERTSASLLALELMQDRDIYKSLLRSEAVLATMVEVLIQKEHDRVTTNLRNIHTTSSKMKQTGGGS